MTHADKRLAHNKAASKKSTQRARKKMLVARFGKEAAKEKLRLAIVSRDAPRSKLNVANFKEVLEEVRKRRIAQRFVRESRERYLEAIGMALALYHATQALSDPVGTLEKLVKETGQRVTKRTNLAQIVVRAVIDYGTSDDEKRVSRKIVSRDAAAVEHLVERGIPPGEVVALGKKKGEGLEAWGRPKPRRKPAPTRLRTALAEEPWDERDENTEGSWAERDESADESKNDRKVSHKPRQITAVPEEQIKLIERIANAGPLICRAPDDDATVWGVISVRLEGIDSQADPERAREMLIDALEEYVERLMA